MGLLDGKTLLITGVITDASIAFAAAQVAQEQGATVVLTGFGRGLGLTRRMARRLPSEPPVLELDVTDEEHLASLPDRLREHGFDRLDGLLHAIGFAPASALGYLATSQFWFESFQNWQSEFLSVAVLVLLSVWLREQGSPQSKPVAASYGDTGA